MWCNFSIIVSEKLFQASFSQDRPVSFRLIPTRYKFRFLFIWSRNLQNFKQINWGTVDVGVTKTFIGIKTYNLKKQNYATIRDISLELQKIIAEDLITTYSNASLGGVTAIDTYQCIVAPTTDGTIAVVCGKDSGISYTSNLGTSWTNAHDADRQLLSIEYNKVKPF